MLGGPRSFRSRGELDANPTRLALLSLVAAEDVGDEVACQAGGRLFSAPAECHGACGRSRGFFSSDLRK